MEIFNTTEDIESFFDEESKAIGYFTVIRWGKFASCPYCNNDRAYFIENGRRFKCASKECRKKFSVTVKTIIEATNIKLHVWIKAMFIYAKSRGRISPFDMAEICKLSSKTEVFAREKLDFIWSRISPQGKSSTELLVEMITLCINLFDVFQEIKEQPNYSNPFHVRDEDVNDISDVRQYNILLRYTRYYMRVYCYWIFLDYASPQDILSETFIWMNENGIREYNGTSMIKLIQATVSRTWTDYLKKHPKYHNHTNVRHKYNKREQIEKISNGYLVSLIKSSKSGKGMTTDEIRKNRELLEQTRIRIRAKRKTDL